MDELLAKLQENHEAYIRMFEKTGDRLKALEEKLDGVNQMCFQIKKEMDEDMQKRGVWKTNPSRHQC